MSYRLNKTQLTAIKWYCDNKYCRVYLSLLPTVTFIDSKDVLVNVHIKVVQELYELSEKA